MQKSQTHFYGVDKNSHDRGQMKNTVQKSVKNVDKGVKVDEL